MHRHGNSGSGVDAQQAALGAGGKANGLEIVADYQAVGIGNELNNISRSAVVHTYR